MNDSNNQTLEAYEQGAQQYADHTSSGPSKGIRGWLDRATSGLPLSASIFEIGSATGRDARYLLKRGFQPECSDAALSFVRLLNEQGLSARPFNALKDSFSKSYDLIFANAVFVHFTSVEVEQVFASIKSALSDEGKLAFTVIEGEGSEWSDAKIGSPRYFSYWNESNIRAALDCTGFSIVYLEREKVRSRIWLNIVAAPHVD